MTLSMTVVSQALLIPMLTTCRLICSQCAQKQPARNKSNIHIHVVQRSTCARLWRPRAIRETAGRLPRFLRKLERLGAYDRLHVLHCLNNIKSLCGFVVLGRWRGCCCSFERSKVVLLLRCPNAGECASDRREHLSGLLQLSRESGQSRGALEMPLFGDKAQGCLNNDCGEVRVHCAGLRSKYQC